ncbi:hypothetical protein KFK09_018241 [Dendrobium nobile]|uniref:RING-type E3 ubiquitin transferase n=1 Tax=Dendrobium nobile TaxID=94219 RepID=A0A8T3AUB3_DENNO|nr:hypothetical protein KFK09_018241 [Dendrobium nobile]
MSTFISFIFQILGLEDFFKTSEESSTEELQMEYCCVCLSSLEEGEGTRKLPCRHMFHRECVDRWLALCRRTCPLCRLSIDAKFFSFGELDYNDELVIWFSTFLVPGY